MKCVSIDLFCKSDDITAVPSAVNLWMDALDWYPVDLSSLESIHVGRLIYRKDAKRLSAAFSCAVQQSYGMTEGILTLTSPEAPEEIAFTPRLPFRNDRPLYHPDKMGNLAQTAKKGN